MHPPTANRITHCCQRTRPSGQEGGAARSSSAPSQFASLLWSPFSEAAVHARRGACPLLGPPTAALTAPYNAFKLPSERANPSLPPENLMRAVSRGGSWGSRCSGTFTAAPAAKCTRIRVNPKFRVNEVTGVALTRHRLCERRISFDAHLNFPIHGEAEVSGDQTRLRSRRCMCVGRGGGRGRRWGAWRGRETVLQHDFGGLTCDEAPPDN